MANKKVAYEDYEEEDNAPAPRKKGEEPRRHKKINFKRLWEDHQDDFDELDEFYGKSK